MAVMKKLIFLFLSMSSLGFSGSPTVGSSDSALEKKIQAFNEFENEKNQFESERESHRLEVLRNRRIELDQREHERQKYLEEKAKLKVIKPEETPQYEAFLLEKWEKRQQQQSAAEEVVNEQKKRRPTKKEAAFEVREYGLQDVEKNRVPYNKRNLVTGKTSGGSSYGGGYSGGNNSYSPPPPMEDVPEFDNDIPPPPPPPPPMPVESGEIDGPDSIPAPPPPLQPLE